MLDNSYTMLITSCCIIINVTSIIRHYQLLTIFVACDLPQINIAVHPVCSGQERCQNC